MLVDSKVDRTVEMMAVGSAMQLVENSVQRSAVEKAAESVEQKAV